MPRHSSITARQIQKARAEWYAYHYEKRAKFKALGVHDQHIYQEAAMRISPPQMTVYGGFQECWPTSEETKMLARIQGLTDFDLACPWYVSDYGWQTFQESWRQLPEPVSYPQGACVQNGALVHIVHRESELSPTDRA